MPCRRAEILVYRMLFIVLLSSPMGDASEKYFFMTHSDLGSKITKDFALSKERKKKVEHQAIVVLFRFLIFEAPKLCNWVSIPLSPQHSR